MSEFIQIGVTSLRDPVSGELLEAVPLYVRAADARPDRTPAIRIGSLAGELAGKVGEYVDGLKQAGLNA